MRMQNLTEFIESSIAIVALLGIITISTVGVVYFNPQLDESSSVAGVNADVFSFEYENKYEVPRHSVQVDEENGVLTYEILVKSLPKGALQSKLVEIKNSAGVDREVHFSAYVDGYAKGDVEISIIESQSLISKDLISGSKGAEFDISPTQTQMFSIKYNAMENINFPFKIILEVR